jgi:hypothetical protein
MDTAGSDIPMSVLGSTYPLELLGSATQLRDHARDAAGGRDFRNIPTVTERAYARGAIFTAFNFLESLLIELVQDHVTNGPIAGTPDAMAILDDLKEGRTKISTTMQDWTVRFAGGDIRRDHRFTNWKVIRGFRNQMVHPKLEPLDVGDLTQDQLLRRANAGEADWFLGEVSRMAEALYAAFGKRVPPEVSAAASAAPRHRPPQL